MTYRCKVATGCPHDLDTCCGVCEHRESCENPCDSHDYMTCPEAEIITDELASFQSSVPATIQKITSLISMKKQMEEQEKKLKQELVKAMEKYGVKVFENDTIKMTYVAPTTRSTIDSARLKKDHPDIAEQYSKTSDVAASVRVALKGGEK